MDLQMYKIYNFTNRDVKSKKVDGQNIYNIQELKEDDLKLCEIRLRESMFLKSFLKYKDLEYEREILLEDFILVELNENEDIAREQLISGISFNNKLYKYFLITANWMKYEDSATKGKGKYLFISEDVYEFKSLYENLLSLNRLSDYEGTEKCINKEISRLGLGLSSAKQTTLKPRYVILPEATYNIVSDIVTIIDDEVAEITEDSPEQLLQHRNRKVTQFDGCGVMSMEFAKEIQEELNLNHKVNWVGIRQYGVATKGLVCSIDFNKYFDEHYAGDTKYFERTDGKFYIRDMFDELVCVSDADMILNESMVKWAKNFDSMEDIKKAMELEEFTDYKDMLENLWICKVNKDPMKIDDYNLTNYQLISNLNLTVSELAELQKPTKEMYDRILEMDFDSVSLFLKTLTSSKEVERTNEDDEIEEMETTVNPSSVIDSLLAINPHLIELGYVKRQLARMIKKQIELLCSGKIYVKSYYKTVIQDPISFLDWILKRTDKEKFIDNSNGLRTDEFYCTEVIDGEVRNISRNPLNSFSEIINAKCVRRHELNRWYGHLGNDLFIVNCYDLSKEIMSGMDFDLDMINVVDNQIIINSTVSDLPFINIFDGEDDKREWNSEGIKEALIKPRGNLIGILANLGARVSNIATENSYKAYRNINTGDIGRWSVLYDAFIEYYKKHKAEGVVKDDKGNTVLDDKEKAIKVGSYEDFKYQLETKFEEVENPYDDEYYKEEITKGLMDSRLESYRLRNLQMKAIDSPKTMQVVGEEEYEDLKDKFKNNPHFMRFINPYSVKIKYKYSVNALNINAGRINKELLSKVRDIRKSTENRGLFRMYLVNHADNGDDYDTIKKEIKDIYKDYRVNSGKINAMWKKEKAEIVNNIKMDIGYREYKNKIKKLDIELAFKVKDFLAEYGENYIEIADILAKRTSVKFALTFFLDIVLKRLEETSGEVDKYKYTKDVRGDVGFKFQSYRKDKVDKLKIDYKEVLENSKYSGIKVDEVIGLKPIDVNEFKGITEVLVDVRDKLYKGLPDPTFKDVNGKEITKILYLNSWKNKDVELLDLVGRKLNVEIVKVHESGNINVRVMA